jgi:hypothetical protein
MDLSRDTLHSTLQIEDSGRMCLLQPIEKHGRPVGTRTPDLYRVKVAL